MWLNDYLAKKRITNRGTLRPAAAATSNCDAVFRACAQCYTLQKNRSNNGVKMISKLQLPYISERIREITLIENDLMYVADYDSVYRVKLGIHIEVEELSDLDPYEFASSCRNPIAVNEENRILEHSGNKISYKFRSVENSQLVEVEIDSVKRSIEFRTLSGDWFCASFSKCGSYILLAEPYLIEIYRLDKDV